MDSRSRSRSRPSSDENKLIQSLTFQMTELIESHSCLICHEILNAPVRLPCTHLFCSLCIRRHLSRSSTCPHPTCPTDCTTSDLDPLRHYDVTLEKLRIMQRTSVPGLKRVQCSSLPLPGNLSRATLVNKLRSVGLQTIGTLETLQVRYREFVLRVNAASDSAFGAPKHKVLDQVRRYEEALSEPQRGLNGFSGRSAHQLVAQQGDSFEELVRKTKRRKDLQTRASASQDIPQRHEKERVEPAEGDKKPDSGEESKDVKQDKPKLQGTSNPRKRPRSATAQSHSAEKAVDVHIVNLPPTLVSCTEVALCSSGVNIQPGKYLPGQTPSSVQKLTQVTPPSASNPNLTEEQIERMRRNKMAAMERRRQNSQQYVRRLPFNGTQETP